MKELTAAGRGVRPAGPTPSARPASGGLGEGAALAAPTAPHATPPGGARARSGPERFWSRRQVRVATAAGGVLSVLVHGSLIPLPGAPLEVTDVEGEAAIPIEVLSASPIATLEPPLPEPSAPAPNPVDTAGSRHEAVADAGASPRAADAATADAASLDGEVKGDAAPLSTDAATPRDPQALLGTIQSEPALVTLVIDVAVIRKHPVGARLGYLVRGIPQWSELLRGTPIDPVRDVDWIVIGGPSFVNTARDVVLVRYGAPDREIDRLVAATAKRSGRPPAFDAGAGVIATALFADRAERVVLRPQPHLLAVVPPASAQKVAGQLASAHVVPPIRPGDAVYFRFVHPHRAVAELPESLDEMRVRVVPRADEGADVLVDADTKDAAAAALAMVDIARFVRRHNDTLTSLVTHGLLDHVLVTSEGAVVKIRLSPSSEQIANLAALVGDLLGVQPDEPPAAPSAGQSVPGAPRNLR